MSTWDVPTEPAPSVPTPDPTPQPMTNPFQQPPSTPATTADYPQGGLTEAYAGADRSFLGVGSRVQGAKKYLLTKPKYRHWQAMSSPGGIKLNQIRNRAWAIMQKHT